ncbi:hypothetical protein M0804_002263 [Polistes exclamans]|nr:hypothetical protein M0804_002263 [Polistes exclamans]
MQDVAKVQSKGERSGLRGCGGDGYLRCDPELPSSSSFSSSSSSSSVSHPPSLPSASPVGPSPFRSPAVGTSNPIKLYPASLA